MSEAPSQPRPARWRRARLAAATTLLASACHGGGSAQVAFDAAGNDISDDSRHEVGATEDTNSDDARTGSDSGDIGDTVACTTGDCTPSPLPAELVPLDDPFGHTFVFDPLEDPIAIGPGGALLDHDGDGDVDVFLGGTNGGTGPCLYENRSTPGTIAFVAVDTVCQARWIRRIHTGAGVDTGSDGTEELLVGGSRFLGWAPTGDGDVALNLFESLLDDADTRRRCDVSTLVPVDLDLDGELEVYVGCGHAAVTAGPPANLVFDPDPDAPRFWTAEECGLLADAGHTLAVAVVDLDANGLPDLVLADDTLSGPGARNLTEEPGGALIRGPVPDLSWTLHRFAGGYTAWGSFMGIAVLAPAATDADPGATLYLTDRGPNRVVTWDGDGFSDALASDWAALALGYGSGDDDLFAWAAVTADFDGDGDRDLYVSQGDVWPDRIAYGLDVGHEDVIAWFADGVPARVTPRSEVAPSDPDPTRNVRSAAAFDVDGDGILELLTIPLEGPVRIDRVGVESTARVCTVRPRVSVAASRALGFEYRLGERWWPAEIEGRSRLGGPPHLTLPAGTVDLRFPSGFEVTVSCPAGGRVSVAEPAWLSVSDGSGSVTVVGPSDLEFTLESSGNATVVEPGTYPVTGPWRATARRNGRSIARIWQGGDD